MNLKAARRALARFTWETDPQTQPAARAALIRALRVSAAVARDTVHGGLRLQAAGLVYTSLLALIPLLAVVFAVLKVFGAHDLLKPMLLNFLAPLGETGAELARQILQFVAKMRVGLLGAVGFGLLLYTSVSLIRKVEQALNSIWRVRQGRRWVRRLSDYVAVIVLGPLLFFLALGLTASLSANAWLKPFYQFAGKLVPYVLVIGAHCLVYVFIPNTKVRVRSALVGATVAGVLWQSAGFAFAAFLAASGQYRVIYASLAILILFMIWLYLSWLILLIGASIAHYHQHPERITREPPETAALLDIQRRERLGLLIARRIGARHCAGREPWTAEALALQLQHPLPAVEQLLATYVDAGLLARTLDAPAAYLPKHALETVPLGDIVRAIHGDAAAGAAARDAAVERLMEELRAARERILAGRTWRDLALADVEVQNVPSGDAISGKAAAKLRPSTRQA